MSILISKHIGKIFNYIIINHLINTDIGPTNGIFVKVCLRNSVYIVLPLVSVRSSYG